MECKGSGVRTLWAGGGKRPTEEVVELDAAGHPGTVLGEQLAAAAGQPVSRPGKHVDRTGEFEGVDGLAQHPDRQVDKAVGVEGTSSERGAEPIAELSAVGHPGAVLAEQLTAAAGQPPSRPGKHVDRARILGGAHVLGAADGQVDEAIAAEVANGNGGAEVVAELGHPGHPGAVLGQQLAARTGQPASRPGKQGDRPAAVSGAVVLARGADGEVEEAVAIEVASAE